MRDYKQCVSAALLKKDDLGDRNALSRSGGIAHGGWLLQNKVNRSFNNFVHTQ